MGAAALLLAAGAAAPALADDAAEPGRRVSFAVEAAREVPNDWMRAVVGVTEEDADPAQAADRVNRAMSWALEQARGETRVKARSGGYHTQPVYHEGKLRRWRASQDLVLEGSDADAMTALLGTLQSRLQLRSFAFSVSDEQRRRVEEELDRPARAPRPAHGDGDGSRQQQAGGASARRARYQSRDRERARHHRPGVIAVGADRRATVGRGVRPSAVISRGPRSGSAHRAPRRPGSGHRGARDLAPPRERGAQIEGL
jgi:hypothetical protein